jgi:hypothetical protein
MTQTDFNHLLSSIKALSPEQMQRLRQQLDRQLAAPPKPPAKAKPPDRTANRPKAAPSATQPPRTEEEFNRHLLSIGLLTSLPDPAFDIDDDDPEDQPIAIEGEPRSETIIRERR